MAQIKIRELDDWIVGVLRDKALAEGHSLEQHLRDVLKDVALDAQMRFAEEQAKFLVEFEEEFGVLPDSTEGIRQDRSIQG